MLKNGREKGTELVGTGRVGGMEPVMEACGPFVFCHFLMVTMSIPLRVPEFFQTVISSPLFQAEECISCCFHRVRLAARIPMQSIYQSINAEGPK